MGAIQSSCRLPWIGYGQEIPEAAAIHMKGLPLSSLISHPLLDTLPLTIERMRQEDDSMPRAYVIDGRPPEKIF